MASLPITAVSPAQRFGDAWISTVVVGDGDERLNLEVQISGTQRAVAGLPEISPAWIAERLRRCAPLLDNYRPVLEQVREWEQPLRLRAEPS